VPISASRAASREATNSSVGGASSKWTSLRGASLARRRSCGASFAAAAARPGKVILAAVWPLAGQQLYFDH